MTPEETTSLFNEGRNAWNAWARRMDYTRLAMIKDGTWVDSDENADWNELTRDWHRAAGVDFSNKIFSNPVKFADYIFPGQAIFDYAVFQECADFRRAVFQNVALFRGVKFRAKAYFYRARFDKFARFRDVVFEGDAIFEHVDFKGAASFYKSVFHFQASFYRISVSRRANFIGAVFKRDTWFNHANFFGVVRFGEAIFYDESNFGASIFYDYVTFECSLFFSSVDFTAIRVERAFSLSNVRFRSVPDFEQSHFEEAPRLDVRTLDKRATKLGIISFLKRYVRDKNFRKKKSYIITKILKSDLYEIARASYKVFGFDNTEDLTARWRALKRLAAQAHDHAREQYFFRNEILAKRLIDDKLWHTSYYAGLGYQLLSNFGQAIFRPILFLALATFLFASSYLDVYFQQKGMEQTGFGWYLVWAKERAGFEQDQQLQCIQGTDHPGSAALRLSVRRALVLPGVVSPDALNPIEACLYGAESPEPQPLGKLVPPYRPTPPAVVGWLGVGQSVVSAVLLFLLGLGLRNHFRID
jgi:uncharacterized protein YjbI with pentapeptide repeats